MFVVYSFIIIIIKKQEVCSATTLFIRVLLILCIVFGFGRPPYSLLRAVKCPHHIVTPEAPRTSCPHTHTHIHSLTDTHTTQHINLHRLLINPVGYQEFISNGGGIVYNYRTKFRTNVAGQSLVHIHTNSSDCEIRHFSLDNSVDVRYKCQTLLVSN